MNPDRERFSVPHASRDPKILVDRDLGNKNIFDLVKNPPEMRVVRIFENPEFWDTTKGQIKALTTQGVATIQLSSGPMSLDAAQWHLIKHTLHDSDTNPPQHTTRADTTIKLGQRQKASIVCLEGTTSSKRRNPSHQIPREHGPNYPTLLQKCRKMKRENIGRKDLNPTTDSD